MQLCSILSNSFGYSTDSLGHNTSANSYCSCLLHESSDIIFLKMLRAWYDTLNENDAEWYQRLLLSYKSEFDFRYAKERKWWLIGFLPSRHLYSPSFRNELSQFESGHLSYFSLLTTPPQTFAIVTQWFGHSTSYFLPNLRISS